MRKSISCRATALLYVILGMVLVIGSESIGFSEEQKKLPNIIFILADDKYKHEPETIEKTSYIPRLMPFLS